MPAQALIAFSLASAIGAELLLFAVFLLSKGRRNPALHLLAGLSLLLAGIIVANLAIGMGAWSGLADLVLFADLCVPPVTYLYIRQLSPTRPPIRRRDLVHALPPILGLGAWVGGLASSMDAYVIACWILYLGAAAYRFARDGDDHPRALWRFVVALLGVFTLIVVLRVTMALRAGSALSFLTGAPYLMVLVATFAATCLLLFTALRFPDLLGGGAGSPKYTGSTVSDAGLRALVARFDECLEVHKPYLDPDLTLTALAARLEAPPRHVSQLVNARFGVNVPAYLNRRRVEEAIRRLTAAPATPIKVVMFESGFRSKSIFNREFQRCAGMSPSEFRRTQRSNPL